MKLISRTILLVLITLMLSSGMNSAKANTTVYNEPQLMGTLKCISLGDHLPIDGVFEDAEYADIPYAELGTTGMTIPSAATHYPSKTMVDGMMDVWVYVNGGALHISVMLHDSSDPTTGTYDQMSVALLVPGQPGEDPVDVKTLRIDDALGYTYLDQYQVGTFVFENDTISNGDGAAARNGEYQFYEFRIPMEEDYVEDVNLGGHGMNYDSFDLAAFFYYGDDVVTGYSLFAGAGQLDYLNIRSADSMWFPEIALPNGTFIWDDSIVIGEHYSLDIFEFNMPFGEGTPWAAGKVYDFKAHLELPTWDYASWLNSGGIVGMIPFDNGTTYFEQMDMPFIIPIDVNGTGHSYSWFMGQATINQYLFDPDVSIGYGDQYLNISHSPSNTHLDIGWNEDGVCTHFIYASPDFKMVLLSEGDGDGPARPIFPDGGLIWDDEIVIGKEFYTRITEYTFAPEDDMGPFNWAEGDNFWFWAETALPSIGSDYEGWMTGGGIMGSIGAGAYIVDMPLIVPTGIVGETHTYVWLMGNATSHYYDGTSVGVTYGDNFLTLSSGSMSYTITYDDRGVCIGFYMVMEGKVLHLEADGDGDGDMKGPVFPDGELIWDDAVVLDTDFYTKVTEFTFTAEDDIGPFNWTIDDHFWFWADIALPTAGSDYLDWMSTDGIMGSTGTGDYEVEMPLLVPTGIVGETYSYVWLMGNASTHYYVGTSVGVTYGDNFITISNEGVTYTIKYDDRGVCVDFLMEMDGKRLHLEYDSAGTDPTDDDDAPPLAFSSSVVFAPMIFIACLTYVRRRK